jgi:hypothetical protein
MATTTPAPYPLGLRRPLASKTRTQPAAFALREPRRGTGYVQATGTDVPAFWELQVGFRQSDAQRIPLWFRTELAVGVRPFIQPLGTEFGDVEHTCQFLPDGLLDHGSQAGVHTYSAKVMARRLVVPEAFLEAGELIAELPAWDEWAALLDSAVAELPGLQPVLLMHFDGADGATTTGDAMGHAITAAGGITLSTAAARFGVSSSRMPGVVGCWQTPASADWNFGAGPFTVDAWVRFDAAPDSRNLIGQWYGSSGLGWLLGFRGGALVFLYSTTGSDSVQVGAAWAPALNTWHHVAADRDASGTLRVYVNGAVIASAAAPSAISPSSLLLEIGGSVVGFAGPLGYMDEARIVKGAAAFGGSFAPPAGPY